MTRRRRIAPPKERRNDSAYRQLWRMVDGALVDTIKHHPEYFRSHSLATMRRSIAKRVVGAVLGYAGQLPAQGRSGQNPAADNGSVVSLPRLGAPRVTERSDGLNSHRHALVDTSERTAGAVLTAAPASSEARA